MHIKNIFNRKNKSFKLCKINEITDKKIIDSRDVKLYLRIKSTSRRRRKKNTIK